VAISSAMGSAGAVPIGVVNPFAGATAPSGWLLCFGQLVSRSQYSGLFSVINTTYGSGDGSTTFALPDMRGRAVAGKDDMGGSAASRITAGVTGVTGTTLGAAGGDQRVHAHSHANTLTNNAVTSGSTNIDHSHNFSPVSTPLNNGWSISGGGAGYMTGGNGITAGMNSNTTHSHSVTSNVTITNATFPVSGTAVSQNLQPTIILNYIIKAQ
jgi:microcystin-dependent protein